MSEPSDEAVVRSWKRPLPWSDASRVTLTRWVLLRALGFNYFVAFLILWNQGDGLFGRHGILPAEKFLNFVHGREGATAYIELPTVFWVSASDPVLRVSAGVGVALSVATLLGFTNSLVMFALWVLYLSFTHIGQIFYGYGWEILLLEAGFLGCFLAAPLSLRPFPRSPTPVAVIWLYRWLVFRVMLGAGLIKLRGDPCWRELTCLVDHYESQPNPGPLSYYFDALPLWADKGGVLFNHLVEVVAPFGVFGPRRVRITSGLLIITFQTLLILSGNLAFLNWLTIAVALSCFDDGVFRRLVPARLRPWLDARVQPLSDLPPTAPRSRVIQGLVAVVVLLSLAPTFNLLLPEQQMNASFDPFHLVNTYGAFGSVDHERHEVIIEGTSGDPLSGDVKWQEYGFHCKPGDVHRRPCLVTPYHYRLDWQMWFAGHRETAGDFWFVKLVYELLRGNPHVTALLDKDPFAGTRPRYIRALLYRYSFPTNLSRGYWDRELLGEYLRPMAVDDATLTELVRSRGWDEDGR